MEIFNETKNKYIQATIALINRIYEGECIVTKAFDREFYEEADDNDNILGLEYVTKLKKEYKLFDLSDKNKVQISKEASIRILPCTAEKLWLKSALQNEKMKLFLSAESIENLNIMLGDVPEIDTDRIIDVKGLSDTADHIDEEFIERFRIILSSIQEQRYLIYSNTARSGAIFENEIATPLKIEYSITQQRFRLSLWSEKEKRPIKTNIESMYQVSMGDSITEMKFKSVKEMLEQKKSPEPLVIIISDKNNACERAALLFSQYDRICRWENEDTLIMEISYYTFDEDELISNIMSFGPAIKVIGPQVILSKMISRLYNRDTE